MAETEKQESDLVASLNHQGKTKPANFATLRDRMTVLGVIVAMVAMVDEQPHVRVMHSFMRYASPCGDDFENDGKMMCAVGDRQGDIDPHFVHVKAT